MTSIVQICNLALVAKLGQKRIASLTENSTEARACTDVYEFARNFVTADVNWRHALAITDLAVLTNNREDDWAYRYARPSDCLRIVRLLPEGGLIDPRTRFRHEATGGSIYCDVENARLQYMQIVTDPTQFSPGFVNALSSYMASLLVQPLQLDPGLRFNMLQLYKVDRDHAMATDDGVITHELTADEALPDWMQAR